MDPSIFRVWVCIQTSVCLQCSCNHTGEEGFQVCIPGEFQSCLTDPVLDVNVSTPLQQQLHVHVHVYARTCTVCIYDWQWHCTCTNVDTPSIKWHSSKTYVTCTCTCIHTCEMILSGCRTMREWVWGKRPKRKGECIPDWVSCEDPQWPGRKVCCLHCWGHSPEPHSLVAPP